MKLGQFETEALEGKHGEGLALAARIIVNLGEFFNAPRTIRIESAHISGVSVKTGGKALERVLEKFIKGGARTRIPAFLNPAGFDMTRFREMEVEEEFFERQMAIIEKFKKLGVIPALTCTPYQNGLIPKKGDMLAWSESSAVSFANSYIGARTNREGGLSALAAAMLGRIPYYGLLVSENRKPNLRVTISKDLGGGLSPREELFMIGLIIGKKYASSIPYITGVAPTGPESYKGFGAAMAATGNISLYHIEGNTPEWEWARNCLDGFQGGNIPELRINSAHVEKMINRSIPEKMPSLMVTGCPHSSVEEMVEIDRKLKKKIQNTRLWIFTSGQTRNLCERMGLVDSLKEKGVEVFSDTCMVVSQLEKFNFDLVATNSGKALHYLPRMGNVATAFMPMSRMLVCAQEGKL